MKRTLAAAALLTLICTGSAAAEPAHVGWPSSIASLGDSGSTGFYSEGVPADRRQNSWSTGANPAVRSHYLRILAANPKIRGHAISIAKGGSDVTDLARQAQLVALDKPDYVTVDFGSVSYCRSVRNTAYGRQWAAGLAALSRILPNARIFVTSIWWGESWLDTVRASPEGRLAASDGSMCDPLYDTPQEHQRRADLDRQFNEDNAAIAAACARLIHCRYDGGASASVVPTLDDLARDFGHPSVQGIGKIADATWPATFDFTDGKAPVSKAQLSGRTVTLTATDDRGVAGIEYRLGKGGWIRYSRPFVLKKGIVLTWRAVDVNGNSEATHTRT